MRFLDIAVATMIGTSGLAALGVWNPQASDSTAAEAALRIKLHDGLVSAVEAMGLAALSSLPFSDLCTQIATLPVDSYTLSASVGPSQCDPSPPQGLHVESMTLDFGGRSVTVEAW